MQKQLWDWYVMSIFRYCNACGFIILVLNDLALSVNLPTGLYILKVRCDVGWCLLFCTVTGQVCMAENSRREVKKVIFTPGTLAKHSKFQ